MIEPLITFILIVLIWIGIVLRDVSKESEENKQQINSLWEQLNNFKHEHSKLKKLFDQYYIKHGL